ncbi:hypothetical protein P5V15_008361 [Pogonomyrmex californicus]
MSIILARSFGGRNGEVGEKQGEDNERGKRSFERNRASESQSLGGLPYVQPEQPAPERPESTKRGRSVSRGREAWPQERRQRSRAVVVPPMQDAGPWDLLDIYELVSSLRGSLSSLGTRVNHE